MKMANEGRMRSQPLSCVRDVEASSCWCQRFLGYQSAHGGTEYRRLASHGMKAMTPNQPDTANLDPLEQREVERRMKEEQWRRGEKP